MNIEKYKYQKKQDSQILIKARTDKRIKKKAINEFHKKYFKNFDPYWWASLSFDEKYVIYSSQLYVPTELKEYWLKDMHYEYNKKAEIRNHKINELLESI